MTKELRALAEAASKGPFKFGVGDHSPKGDFIVQEKPPTYRGLGYCDSPGIFTEAGENIVGNYDYHVFSGPDNVAYMLALLNEAPALLDRLDRQEKVMREAVVAIRLEMTHGPLIKECHDAIAALEKELK